MVNISIVAAITLVGIAMGLAIISYLLSTEEGGNTGQGIMDRISRRVSTHSMKNIIVMWQILTQVRIYNGWTPDDFICRRVSAAVAAFWRS